MTDNPGPSSEVVRVDAAEPPTDSDGLHWFRVVYVLEAADADDAVRRIPQLADAESVVHICESCEGAS